MNRTDFPFRPYKSFKIQHTIFKQTRRTSQLTKTCSKLPTKILGKGLMTKTLLKLFSVIFIVNVKLG